MKEFSAFKPGPCTTKQVQHTQNITLTAWFECLCFKRFSQYERATILMKHSQFEGRKKTWQRVSLQ